MRFNNPYPAITPATIKLIVTMSPLFVVFCAPVKTNLLNASRFLLTLLALILLAKAGKIVNVVRKAITIPRHMIQPKSMTGRIPLTISEAKATIVVSAV